MKWLVGHFAFEGAEMLLQTLPRSIGLLIVGDVAGRRVNATV